MPSGAAHLPGHRGGRCRHCGAVIGCRAPQTLQPERGLRRPAGGRRRRGRPGRPDTGHAVRRAVRVRCPPCGQTSVQRVGRTSGVQASGVQASGVQASGVMRVSGQTGVRCPRPLQPRCPHRAGSRIRRCGGTGHGRRSGLDVSPWSVSGLGVAARIGPGEEGMVVRQAVCGWHEWRRQTWPPLRTRRLGRRARRLGDQGSWSSARCRWGGRGSTGKEQGRTRRPAGASWAGCRRDARHGAGPGGGDHAGWSLRWCWSGVVRLREGPSGSAGSRLRPQRGRGRSGALSARR
jgi:hypothetical protein